MTYKNKVKNKVLALLLAFVFIIGELPVLASFTDAGFNWLSRDQLTNDLRYVSRPAILPEDEVLLSFLLPDTEADKNFTLTYHLRDNEKFEATFTKKGEGYVDVIFTAFTYTMGAWVKDKTKLMGYKVFYNGQFVDPQTITYDPVQKQRDLTNLSDPLQEYLHFNASENNGFAISLTGAVGAPIFRFKWEKRTPIDRILFSVNSAIPDGHFYDFTLKAPTSPEELTLHTLTGLNLSKFESIPFDAAHPSYVANHLSKTGDIVDHTVQPITAYPGSKTGVYLHIEKPYIWDETKGKFVQEKVDIYGAKFDTTVKVSEFVSFKIENILETPTIVGTPNNVSLIIPVNETNNAFFTVKIDNMPASRLYDRSYIEMTGTTAKTTYRFNSRVTELKAEDIYTFLEYQMIAYGVEEGISKFYLRITPYAEYSKNYNLASGTPVDTTGGFYRLKVRGDRPINNKDYTQGDIVLEDIKDTKKAAYIFLPVDETMNVSGGTGLDNWYVIEYSSVPIDDNRFISSQVLGYQSDASSLHLDTPTELAITDSYITIDNMGEERLVLDIEWLVGAEKILEEVIGAKAEDKIEELFYHFFKRDSLNDGTEGEKWLDVQIKFDPNDYLNWDKAVFSSLSNGDVMKASLIDGKLVKVIKENQAIKEFIKAKITVSIPVASMEASVTNRPYFRYPGLYYITNQLSYKKGVSEIEFISGESTPVSLTIDGKSKFQVPQPSGVAGETPIEDGASIQDARVWWQTIKQADFDNYVKQYLIPKKLNMAKNGEKSIYFNVYITENRSILEDLLQENGKKEKTTPMKKVDASQVSIVNDGLGMHFEKNVEGEIIAALRGQELVQLFNLEQLSVDVQEVIFRQLDKNKSYYFVVETVFRPFHIDDIDENGSIKSGRTPYGYEDDETEISILTPILPLTTKDNPKEPTDKYVAPRVPDVFDYYADRVTGSQAIVYWQFTPKLNADEESLYQFEILRIKDHQLIDFVTDGLIQNSQFNKIPLTEVLQNLDAFNSSWEKAAFKTHGDKAGQMTKVYGVNMDSESFEYTKLEDVFELLDKELSPNQVYFYYIRTIKADGSKETAYSNWKGLSLTTSPIDAPINLTEDRELRHDKEHEVFIRFDYIKDILSGTNDTYKFQYSIKPDGKEWSSPTDISSTLLTMEKEIEAGLIKYYNYLYKITGLTQGVAYSIRVRAAANIDGEWVYSNYSNILRTKTDTDSKEQEIDDKTNQWTEYLNQELKELLKREYWVLSDSISDHGGLYRTVMFDGVMAKDAGSGIVLGLGKKANQVFYIPSKAMQKAIDNNKSFIIKEKDTQVTIPASVFSTTNDALVGILKHIEDKSIKDYYVKMEVSITDYKHTITGTEMTSPKIVTNFSLVGSKKDDLVFDKELETYLFEVVAKKMDNKININDIKKMIEDGKSNEDIVKMVAKIVEETADEVRIGMDRRFENNIKYHYVYEPLNGNYAISIKSEAAVSNIYEFINGGWQSMKTIPLFEGTGALVPRVGTFVFASRKIVIPGIESVDNGAIITQIMATYGLDELYGEINLKAPVTNRMVIGTTARLLGASHTADPVQYLQGLGAKVTTRTLDNQAEMQEIVYFTMLVCEQKTNTKVENMKISDYRTVARMQNLDKRYAPYMQAAFELQIMANKNMLPKAPMTLEEYMQTLVRMHKKVKLV